MKKSRAPTSYMNQDIHKKGCSDGRRVVYISFLSPCIVYDKTKQAYLTVSGKCYQSHRIHLLLVFDTCKKPLFHSLCEEFFWKSKMAILPIMVLVVHEKIQKDNDIVHGLWAIRNVNEKLRCFLCSKCWAVLYLPCVNCTNKTTNGLVYQSARALWQSSCK